MGILLFDGCDGLSVLAHGRAEAVSLSYTTHDSPEDSQYRGPRAVEVTMNTSDAKQMPKDAAPSSEHASTPNQFQEGKNAKVAQIPDPKSAKHVCTPACTHEGAKEDRSIQAGTKGTLHASAAHGTTDRGAERGGK
jgi:hypothetical protein